MRNFTRRYITRGVEPVKPYSYELKYEADDTFLSFNSFAALSTSQEVKNNGYHNGNEGDDEEEFL
eukprot:CAMPEP_0168531562 /NCGR_PEP_ID=MMETSP0405-20121227/15565_1 /TAXON_ID=498012 /ORGANISM="Trichosphaerium sp, Strain Am-I-7 wt" /LENGTH=64 /DNA_ID=CAMNT_0008556475 /DNA_START=192 /DNA_END=386 /DNA_ORIENTATION=-